MLSNNTKAFFELLRAGLWEKEAKLSQYGNIDFNEILRLSEEQSVVGVVAAGIEHVVDVILPQEFVLQFVGHALQLENRNLSMNTFLEGVIHKLRENDIYTLLVKGQGIAQCYERPLWRACGDIDLFLSPDNYKKASVFFIPLASKVDNEIEHTKHLALTIKGWDVELHGTLRSGLWRKLERTIDEVQNEVFYGGNVRTWMCGKTQVFLPGLNEDVFFIFTHILQHFYKGGVGLRQICDWSRLIWKHKSSINVGLLEMRLKNAGVMQEWNVLGKIAIDYLGMPIEALPLYSPEKKYEKKAFRFLNIMFETGSFGHNRDVSYQKNTHPIIRKTITMWRQSIDNAKIFIIFPKNSIKAWWSILIAGIINAINGK